MADLGLVIYDFALEAIYDNEQNNGSKDWKCGFAQATYYWKKTEAPEVPTSGLL